MARKLTVISAAAALVLTFGLACTATPGTTETVGQNDSSANGSYGSDPSANNGDVSDGSDQVADISPDSVNGNTGPAGSSGGANAPGVTVVRTSIPIDVDTPVVGGDDIIVFGAPAPPPHLDVRVAYMVPSANDTVAREIPNGDKFSNNLFAVAGKKIALLDPGSSDRGFLDRPPVTIFDTASGTSFSLPLSQINLRSVSLPYGRGTYNDQAGGAYYPVLLP